MHVVLDTRPDFPVSLPLTRNYVYSLIALGETIEPARKEKIIKFIKKIQQSDGGFSIDETHKDTVSSLYTDYALETLAYKGALNAINAGKARSYIASLQQSDGGFSFNKKKNESALATTYYAVHSLYLLNSLNIIDKTKTAQYIKGFEQKDTGGFSYVRGRNVATAKDTYMAVYALKTIGMLDDETKKRAVKFLTSTPYIGKYKKGDGDLTIEEQAYSLSALRILDGTKNIDKGRVIAFLKTFYVSVDGGFSSLRGFKTAPDPTYFGIRSLAELGILKMPVEVQLK